MRFLGAGGKLGFGRGSSLYEAFYVGGTFISANYEDQIGFFTTNRIAKWNTTSSAWEHPFGSAMSATVRALDSDSSGNLYVGGSFTTANGTASNGIAKWNTTSSAWEYPFVNGTSTIDLALDSSGNIYFTGGYQIYNNQDYPYFFSLRNNVLSETPQ